MTPMELIERETAELRARNLAHAELVVDVVECAALIGSQSNKQREEVSEAAKQARAMIAKAKAVTP